MILSLLLQNAIVYKEATTITSLTPVYWALFGTVLASSIAAITAWRASTKASVTANEVATLSRQSAQELKDKDYKNDYYKRVIDKRMKSLEFVSQILSRFMMVDTVECYFEEGVEGMFPPGHKLVTRCYGYFSNNADTLDASQILIPFDESESHNLLWCSPEIVAALYDLFEAIILLVKNVNNDTSNVHNKIILYSLKHKDIESRVNAVERSMVNELKDLYDIEAFLAKKSINLQIPSTVIN
jgi:hypothetical protein